MPPVNFAMISKPNCGNCSLFEPGIPMLYLDKQGVRSDGSCKLKRLSTSHVGRPTLSTNWCDQHKPRAV